MANTLAHIMKLVKGRSAWEINKALQGQGPVWQDEFFDHILRSDESREAKTQYILQNPLRAGLVRGNEPYQWCWEEDTPIL